MGKKKQAPALGKSIIRDRFGKKERKTGDTFLHTSDLKDGYDWGRLNLQSVTEQNNLDDFLTTAELAGTEFTAEKLNVKLVSQETGNLPHADELKTIKGLHKQHEKLLRIPRRPPWSPQMSASELDQNERAAFLDWRRSLASLQEDERIVMTPYEKNLDFWRQLWRVIERSDIVVQIVDARNPLLFYCADLEHYVKEVGKSKMCMVLVNKADFLSEKQRQVWADYFTSKGIRIAFWSAIQEAARQELEAKQERGVDKGDSVGNEEEDDTSSEGEEDDEHEVDMEKSSSDLTVNDENLVHQTNKTTGSSATDKSQKAETHVESNDDETAEKDLENCDVEKVPVANEETEKDLENVGPESTDKFNVHECSCDNSDKTSSEYDESGPCGNVSSAYREMMKTSEIRNSAMIYTGPELLELFKSIHVEQKVNEGLTTVGMVGYPNVGKSSTINAILKMKKVPVSATPGRTKHFQTLFVDPTLMLCDCPGLVFPSFVTTKADLILGGILPIDQMRDYISPTALLCQKIPRWVLETTYGICLPKPAEGEAPDRPPTGYELLNTYGAMRGYMTNRGLPDGPRSARYLLKDYVNGKLLYCHPPPEMDPVEFNGFSIRDPAMVSSSQGLMAGGGQHLPELSKVDADFFKKDFPTVHTRTARGDHELPGGSVSASSSQSSGLNQKPWKKHNNRNKKEKLRRVYGFRDKE